MIIVPYKYSYLLMSFLLINIYGSFIYLLPVVGAPRRAPLQGAIYRLANYDPNSIANRLS